MFSRGQLRAAFTLAVVAVVAQADWSDNYIVEQEERAVAQPNIIARASSTGILDGIVSGVSSAVGSGTSSTAASSTGSSSSSSSSIPTTSSSQTSSSSSSTSPSQTTSAPSSTQSSSSATTTSTSSSSLSSTDSSSPSSSTTTSGKLTTSTTPATTKVVVLTTTSDGQAITTSYTTTSAASTTTGVLQGAPVSKSTGMSSKTKTTIIGVVVGIGGFAIAAGLFVVAWKIWGRKKNEEEGDELMSNIGREKESSAGSGPSNPFQTTLDQYHNPSRNVNASSNF